MYQALRMMGVEDGLARSLEERALEEVGERLRETPFRGAVVEALASTEVVGHEPSGRLKKLALRLRGRPVSYGGGDRVGVVVPPATARAWEGEYRGMKRYHIKCEALGVEVHRGHVPYYFVFRVEASFCPRAEHVECAVDVIKEGPMALVASRPWVLQEPLAAAAFMLAVSTE